MLRKLLEAFAAVWFGCVVTFILCAWLDSCALAEACDVVCSLERAVVTLQPAAAPRRAKALARAFAEAAAESDLDPLLLLAVAMRESSLHPAVEALTRRGSVGELGLMQIHPRNRRALAMRPEGCGPELRESARCQIVTGARWLAYSREACPGSTWRWLTYYGSGRCLDEAAARRDRTTAIAASYYVRAGGSAW